jgi:hypothetical protein
VLLTVHILSDGVAAEKTSHPDCQVSLHFKKRLRRPARGVSHGSMRNRTTDS